MSVYGIGWGQPSLNLLGNALRVGRGEHAELGGSAKSGWEIVEQVGDGVDQAGGCEDAVAEERVTRESVKKRIVGRGL